MSAGALRRYERLEASPYLVPVVTAVRAYLAAAVPEPESTEQERWSLSCLPSTFPDRLAAVSMKWMEVFVLNEPDRPGRPLTGFVIARRSVLEAEYAGRFTDRFPGLDVARSTYRDPGEDQVRVGGDTGDLVAALADGGLALAARELAGRLMRSRTPYARFHNPHLADAVLGRSHRPPST